MNRLYSTLTPFTLLILISAPYLGYLTVHSEGANEAQPIDLTITEFAALRDDYGRPMRNPDGTFYPGDEFKVRYYVWTDVNVTFDKLEVKYDGSVFEPLTSTNTVWNFKIRKTASAGKHEVKFVAHGTYTYTVNYTILKQTQP